ncbi:hypothetical protein FRB98_009013, partial [Tulasnella sp. 332]
GNGRGPAGDRSHPGTPAQFDLRMRPPLLECRRYPPIAAHEGFHPLELFDQFTSRVDLLRAGESLAKGEERKGLRNDAIKVMDVLASRRDLRFLEMSEYHSVADTVIAGISSNTLSDVDKSPAFDFLKTTSDFPVRVSPWSMQHPSFHPHSALWLRSIIYLATKKPERTVPGILRDEEGAVATCQSWALVVFRTAIERSQMVHFWDADNIFRVLSSHNHFAQIRRRAL